MAVVNIRVSTQDQNFDLQENAIKKYADNCNDSYEIYKENEKIIKIIYLLSLIFFIFNIFYLFKYWNRIFIIDFQKNNPLFLFVIMFVFGFIFNFLHELGHFYAAKLTKIDSKIKISQRFIFFLTFECDMSSIWLVENKRRIFPIVAGILTDNILLTVLIGLTTVIESPILFLILFIQYTKNLYHLLIPFKTDLYFLLLFSLNKKSNKELILKTSHYLGYFFLSLIMFIYFIQLYNLYSYATSSSSVEWATLLAIVIILLPIIIFIKERRQKIA